jgi:hypothetical protein
MFLTCQWDSCHAPLPVVKAGTSRGAPAPCDASP